MHPFSSGGKFIQQNNPLLKGQEYPLFLYCFYRVVRAEYFAGRWANKSWNEKVLPFAEEICAAYNFNGPPPAFYGLFYDILSRYSQCVEAHQPYLFDNLLSDSDITVTFDGIAKGVTRPPLKLVSIIGLYHTAIVLALREIDKGQFHTVHDLGLHLHECYVNRSPIYNYLVNQGRLETIVHRYHNIHLLPKREENILLPFVLGIVCVFLFQKLIGRSP